MTETATPTGLSTRDRTFWSVMALFLVSDIITKRWAESSLQLHWPNEVVGHWLRWTLTYNTGAAMNLSLGGASRIVFSIIAVVMVGYLFALYRQARRDEWGTPLALGMIVAGAVGNLIDRLRHTKGVVDFIDVGTAGWRFWTFNVADMGVTVGAVLLAVLLWREDRATRSVNAGPSHTSGTDQ